MLTRTEAADKLTATFPAIKSLVIFDCLFTEVEIAKLLTRWRHTLTSLKLVIFKRYFNWEMILAILNDMPRLCHLSLFSFYGFMWRPQLSFFRQLKTFQLAFNIHTGNRKTWLSHLLGQLNADVLQSLDIGVFDLTNHRSPFFRYNLKQLLHEQPAVASKLRRLHFPSNTQQFCHFIVHKFPSVSWLDLELTSANDLRQISRLSGLKFLAIRSNKLPYSDCPLNRANKKTLAKINPLVSVERLILFDFKLNEKLLKELFPNVNTVERICRRNDDDTDVEEE